MKIVQTTALMATIATCQGFVAPQQSAAAQTALEMTSRRDALATSFATILAISVPSAANAIDACPKGSKNCLRQTWTPPSSTSAADAASQLRDVLNAYPQEGQEDGKVDGGGYTIISDSDGSFKLEYRSSGKGFFAKSFNAGKPFIDDLVIEPNGSSFEFRSASRLGDSDFGVNGKRLSYIGGLLKEKGWTGVGL
mmetsp:Transcript_12139/g.18208  ORF Transcript_12139/g.18208 Transcript_12139/m.18208 type:complete len:195 (+) Transcript_12139:74-658(+)|eukprot:CAMPEP_0113385976 /NCGR_PEP_ID=MMETSP0013_2-20120614/7758_1 /TAXON_ID=2843 ORGANISM="Skeletonema costatum, Strain 1716" /NCGR_SAMPLE_ID=MMETSP0013_2 /ASSEMBLY_ACC=CAM_ASM_000158 /LENGTH=194 /DNA_ID=CAMNT_0000268777 /DNA_START=26 /DNA_END=610 /DNA_ORIENTATION=+ /assembly_acc=CAM_ASM_000158